MPALDSLKKAASSNPVLRYYNLQEEVKLQCYASPSGLGAALMQNGQPCGMWFEGTHSNRDPLYTNREGATGHRAWI